MVLCVPVKRHSLTHLKKSPNYLTITLNYYDHEYELNHKSFNGCLMFNHMLINKCLLFKQM